MRIALVRAAAIVPAYQFLHRIGAPVDGMLARAGLSADVFERSETLVPLVYGMRFLEEGARREGDERFGLRVGAAASLSTLGTFGRQVVRAHTLHDAFAIAVRLAASHNSGERYWIDHGAGEIRFLHQYARRLAPEGHQAEQYALGLALSLCRSVGGPAWRPPRVFLRDGGRGLAGLEVLAGSELVPGQRTNGFVLSRKLLSTPLPAPAPAETGDVVRWHASAPAADFAEAIRQAVTPLLAHGDAAVGVLADATSMSVRTLQRRLHDAGTTYARVLSEARFQVASTLLTGSHRSIGDIAETLGYSHPAHFTRAFVRWTGTTPRRFRGLHGGGTPGAAAAG